MKRMKSALCVFVVCFVFTLMFPCSSSAEPLDNWHVRTAANYELFGVTYGNDKFVAVGSGGTILTSPDGVTWTPRDSGTTYPLLDVTYGNNTFVAVGYYTILTSPDGVTWNPGYSGTISDVLHGIAYGNNTFVAVGYSYGTIYTSPDGVTFNYITQANRHFYAVTYGNNEFVAMGQLNAYLTSPDGAIWTTRYLGPAVTVIGLTYGNNTFVATGYNGLIYTSPDPDAGPWTLRTSGTTYGLFGATYGNNALVVVGDVGKILTSPDGVTWTPRTSGTAYALNNVAYGNNTFVAVGSNGYNGTIVQSDPLSQTFDFNYDSEGWRGVGLYDDGTLNPVPGWFVDVPAPWNNADGDPAPGVIGVGSPNAITLPLSPSQSSFLHADLISPDLSSYTEWQGITSFSYNVTGIWILENQPVAVQAVLRVKKPDNSISYYADGIFHNPLCQ